MTSKLRLVTQTRACNETLSLLTINDFWSQKFAVQDQYFFTRVISQRLGALLAFLAYRGRIRPNTVTLSGLAASLAASGCLVLSSGYDATLLAALALFQLGFGMDCADGQLARATKSASPYGGWLDVAADHVRNVAILLAAGASMTRSDLPPGFLLGGLLIFGSGMCVTLHTATMLRAGHFPAHGLRNWRAVAKQVVKEATDTPLFLLCLCLLVPIPALLLGYLATVGALYLLTALVQAWLRMDRGLA